MKKLKRLFFIIWSLIFGSCIKSNSLNLPNEISLTEKKIILSSIELKEGIYYFDENIAREKGLSNKLILRMKEEIKNVNIDIENAKNLPNSTVELTNPKDLQID